MEKRTNPAVVRSRFVRINVAALRRAADSTAHPLTTMRIKFFGNGRLLDIERHQRVLGHDLFTGLIRGRAEEVSIAIAPDGVTAATFHLVDESYAITYAATGDIHVLQEMDDRKQPLLPRALVAQGNQLRTDRGNAQEPLDTSGKTILDVMMFYTPRAKTTAGGKTAIESSIINALAQANATNNASSVKATFRLVYMAETNYIEDGSTGDLAKFRVMNDGYMDEVHTLRITYGGDLMHLITQPTKATYCGVAYLMTSLNHGFKLYAFGVTLRQCLGGNVVAHEMGHNVGLHHDKNNAGRAIYPYAYGFRTADNLYRTTMAYSPGTRVNMWSSPNHKHLNYTMGKVNSEDNARTLTATKATVASFYPTRELVWSELGGGIKWLAGLPKATGSGTSNNARPVTVSVTNYRGHVPGAMVVGLTELKLPIFGGTLYPSLDLVTPISGVGYVPINFDARLVAALPPKTSIWFQAFFLDTTAIQGVSATNAIKTILP